MLEFHAIHHVDTSSISTSASPPPPAEDCFDLESRARETEEALFCRPMVAVCEEAEGSWVQRRQQRVKERWERRKGRKCSDADRGEVIRISLCSAAVPSVVAQLDSG